MAAVQDLGPQRTEEPQPRPTDGVIPPPMLLEMSANGAHPPASPITLSLTPKGSIDVSLFCGHVVTGALGLPRSPTTRPLDSTRDLDTTGITIAAPPPPTNGKTFTPENGALRPFAVPPPPVIDRALHPFSPHVTQPAHDGNSPALASAVSSVAPASSSVALSQELGQSVPEYYTSRVSSSLCSGPGSRGSVTSPGAVVVSAISVSPVTSPSGARERGVSIGGEGHIASSDRGIVSGLASFRGTASGSGVFATDQGDRRLTDSEVPSPNPLGGGSFSSATGRAHSPSLLVGPEILERDLSNVSVSTVRSSAGHVTIGGQRLDPALDSTQQEAQQRSRTTSAVSATWEFSTSVEIPLRAAGQPPPDPSQQTQPVQEPNPPAAEPPVAEGTQPQPQAQAQSASTESATAQPAPAVTSLERNVSPCASALPSKQPSAIGLQYGSGQDGNADPTLQDSPGSEASDLRSPDLLVSARLLARDTLSGPSSASAPSLVASGVYANTHNDTQAWTLSRNVSEVERDAQCSATNGIQILALPVVVTSSPRSTTVAASSTFTHSTSSSTPGLLVEPPPMGLSRSSVDMGSSLNIPALSQTRSPSMVGMPTPNLNSATLPPGHSSPSFEAALDSVASVPLNSENQSSSSPIGPVSFEVRSESGSFSRAPPLSPSAPTPAPCASLEPSDRDPAATSVEGAASAAAFPVPPPGEQSSLVSGPSGRSPDLLVGAEVLRRELMESSGEAASRNVVTPMSQLRLPVGQDAAGGLASPAPDGVASVDRGFESTPPAGELNGGVRNSPRNNGPSAMATPVRDTYHERRNEEDTPRKAIPMQSPETVDAATRDLDKRTSSPSMLVAHGVLHRDHVSDVSPSARSTAGGPLTPPTATLLEFQSDPALAGTGPGAHGLISASVSSASVVAFCQQRSEPAFATTTWEVGSAPSNGSQSRGDSQVATPSHPPSSFDQVESLQSVEAEVALGNSLPRNLSSGSVASGKPPAAKASVTPTGSEPRVARLTSPRRRTSQPQEKVHMQDQPHQKPQDQPQAREPPQEQPQQNGHTQAQEQPQQKLQGEAKEQPQEQFQAQDKPQEKPQEQLHEQTRSQELAEPQEKPKPESQTPSDGSGITRLQADEECHRNAAEQDEVLEAENLARRAAERVHTTDVLEIVRSFEDALDLERSPVDNPPNGGDGDGSRVGGDETPPPSAVPPSRTQPRRRTLSAHRLWEEHSEDDEEARSADVATWKHLDAHGELPDAESGQRVQQEIAAALASSLVDVAGARGASTTATTPTTQYCVGMRLAHICDSTHVVRDLVADMADGTSSSESTESFDILTEADVVRWQRRLFALLPLVVRGVNGPGALSALPAVPQGSAAARVVVPLSEVAAAVASAAISAGAMGTSDAILVARALAKAFAVAVGAVVEVLEGSGEPGGIVAAAAFAMLDVRRTRLVPAALAKTVLLSPANNQPEVGAVAVGTGSQSQQSLSLVRFHQALLRNRSKNNDLSIDVALARVLDAGFLRLLPTFMTPPVAAVWRQRQCRAQRDMSDGLEAVADAGANGVEALLDTICEAMQGRPPFAATQTNDLAGAAAGALHAHAGVTATAAFLVSVAAAFAGLEISRGASNGETARALISAIGKTALHGEGAATSSAWLRVDIETAFKLRRVASLRPTLPQEPPAFPVTSGAASAVARRASARCALDALREWSLAVSEAAALYHGWSFFTAPDPSEGSVGTAAAAAAAVAVVSASAADPGQSPSPWWGDAAVFAQAVPVVPASAVPLQRYGDAVRVCGGGCFASVGLVPDEPVGRASLARCRLLWTLFDPSVVGGPQPAGNGLSPATAAPLPPPRRALGRRHSVLGYPAAADAAMTWRRCGAVPAWSSPYKDTHGRPVSPADASSAVLGHATVGGEWRRLRAAAAVSPVQAALHTDGGSPMAPTARSLLPTRPETAPSGGATRAAARANWAAIPTVGRGGSGVTEPISAFDESDGCDGVPSLAEHVSTHDVADCEGSIFAASAERSFGNMRTPSQVAMDASGGGGGMPSARRPLSATSGASASSVFGAHPLRAWVAPATGTQHQKYRQPSSGTLGAGDSQHQLGDSFSLRFARHSPSPTRSPGPPSAIDFVADRAARPPVFLPVSASPFAPRPRPLALDGGLAGVAGGGILGGASPNENDLNVGSPGVAVRRPLSARIRNWSSSS